MNGVENNAAEEQVKDDVQEAVKTAETVENELVKPESETADRTENSAGDDAEKEAEIEARKNAVNEYVKERKEEELAHKTRFTGQPFALNCGDWQAGDDGVYKISVNAKGEVSRIMACPHPIMPVERLNNLDEEKEKMCLAFYRDGKWRRITVECKVCFNKQQITSLSDRGILVTSETARYLVQYLADVVALNMNPADGQPIPVSRSISRMGWCGDEFVPYVEDIRYDGDMDFASIFREVRTEGSRDEWYELAGKIRQNKVVRILIAASLASPLIERVGALPFILHLWGTTSFGKTVSLMVAMSVWGNPETGCLTRTMNMTANAMARTAAFLKHLPFGADELQQMKQNWKQSGQNFDQLIMYLTEGIDRSRAKAHGGIENLQTWRNCFIFTGEEPVTKANSGGGARNRVIEVEVTRPIYESGFYVANMVRDHFGWAGKEFIEEVQRYGKIELTARFRLKVEEILKTCDTTDKQAHSMALILLADEISCSSIFDGDVPLCAEDVAEYLHSVKTVDVAERAYQWCLDWIDRNQNRFVAGGNYGEIWGRMGEGFVMINKSVLEEELHKAGYEYDAVSRKWAEKGYIVRASDGRYSHRTSVCGVKANYIKLNLDIEGEEFGVPVNQPPPVEFLNMEQMQIPA